MDEDCDAETANNNGYCHFNENENKTTFELEIYDKIWQFKQEPGARNLGHGAVVWDAAVVMSKYMDFNRKRFNSANLGGKRVLELGSGCGVAGVGFMLRGADVTFTDLDPVAQGLTQYNAERVYRQAISLGRTSLSCELIVPKILPLDWRETPSEPFRYSPYDIVLLTDCVFCVRLIPDLIRTIATCSGPKTEIICCHEIRDEEANAAFVAELKKICNVKRISQSKLHPQFRSDLIELLIAKPFRISK